MKIFVDTNIILDVLCKREKFYTASLNIFKLAEVKKVEAYISSLSIVNIIYIMRKELNEEKMKEIIERLYLIFNVIDLESKDIKKALTLKFNDFEDIVLSVGAKRIKAEYIISRNLNDFIYSPVPCVTPYEFLKIIVDKL